MKHLPILLASASLSLAVPARANAGSADVLVSGSITPAAACTLTLNAGSLDLGKIDLTTLNPDPSEPTELGDHKVPVSVTCPSARRFAFVVTEAGGTGSEPMVFPMHEGNAGAKAGGLFLNFDTAVTLVDGVQGYATGSSMTTTDLEHATWGPSTVSRENLPISNGRYAVGFVMAPKSEDVPVAMKKLTIDLLVRPFVNPLNELDLSAEVALESDIRLEISYF